MRLCGAERVKKHLVRLTFEDMSADIDEEVFAAAKLRVGDEIGDAAFGTLRYKSEFTRARNKALWLCGFRDYSKKELTQKLSREYDKDAAAEAVELLAEEGIVDDRRFAEYYAADLSNLKGLSARSIRQELIIKGIDRDTAEEISSEYDCDHTDMISELISRKYPGCREDEKIRRRMFAALARKGYSFDESKRAYEKYCEDNE